MVDKDRIRTADQKHALFILDHLAEIGRQDIINEVKRGDKIRVQQHGFQQDIINEVKRGGESTNPPSLLAIIRDMASLTVPVTVEDPVYFEDYAKRLIAYGRKIESPLKQADQEFGVFYNNHMVVDIGPTRSWEEIFNLYGKYKEGKLRVYLSDPEYAETLAGLGEFMSSISAPYPRL